MMTDSLEELRHLVLTRPKAESERWLSLSLSDFEFEPALGELNSNVRTRINRLLDGTRPWRRTAADWYFVARMLVPDASKRACTEFGAKKANVERQASLNVSPFEELEELVLTNPSGQFARWLNLNGYVDAEMKCHKAVPGKVRKKLNKAVHDRSVRVVARAWFAAATKFVPEATRVQCLEFAAHKANVHWEARECRRRKRSHELTTGSTT